jgi:hypothetical protein
MEAGVSIKGLTDRNEGAFPQIGIIRKGAPKTQNAPGKDLAYFRVEFDEKEIQAAQDFVNRFTNAPTDITIMLPFNEIGRCWEAWRETYVAGAMIHRCDGERVQYAINSQTGERLVVNGIGQNGQPVLCKGKADGCRPIGRLRVIVPELQRLAYLMVLTTSIHDIINISNQLEAISAMTGGRLAGIPLVLRRRPKKISTPSGANGTRARREKWLVSIEADPEWVKVKLLQMKHDALPGNGFEQLPEPALQSVGPEWTSKLGEDDEYKSDEDEQGEGAVEGEYTTDHTAAKTITDRPDPARPISPVVVEAYQTGVRDGATGFVAPVKKAEWPADVITWARKQWEGISSYQVIGALNQSRVLTDQTPSDEIKHWLGIRKLERDAGVESAEATGRADADYLVTHTK